MKKINWTHAKCNCFAHAEKTKCQPWRNSTGFPKATFKRAKTDNDIKILYYRKPKSGPSICQLSAAKKVMEIYCIENALHSRLKAFHFYQNSQNLKLGFSLSKGFYFLFEKKKKKKLYIYIYIYIYKLARRVLRLSTYQRAAGFIRSLYFPYTSDYR